MSRIALLLVLLTASSSAAADLPSGALVRLGDDRFRAGGGVYHIALSPDGKQFATITYAGGGFLELAVWEASTGQSVRAHRIHEDLFKGMVWGPTGGFMLVGRADRTRQYPDDFQVWKFSDPKADPPPKLPIRSVSRNVSNFSHVVDVPRPDPTNEYTALHLTPDGRRVTGVLKTAQGKYAAHVFDLKPAQKSADLVRVATVDLGAEEAFAARLSPDGKTLVTFRIIRGPDGWEYTATPWTLATGKPQTAVRVPDRYVGGHQTQYERLPLITPDGRALAVYSRKGQDEGYSLLDLETGKPRELIRWKPGDRTFERELQTLGECAYFPSGRVLVDAWTVHPTLIDTATGKELGRLMGHASAPTAIAVSADESRIATADQYGLIRLWDVKTLRPLDDAPGHRRPVEYVQLSPDGKRLLTWAQDDTVRLWDLASGKELRAFTDAPGISSKADRPTFTPDGTTILYSTSKRLIARDIQTGLEVPLPGDMAKPGPRGAVFSPDGKSVLTWAWAVENDQDDVCVVWDWPSGKKRFSWDPSDNNHTPGFSPDGSVVFDHPLSPQRRDAKTGKELPDAWKDNKSHLIELMSLRPNPRWVLRDSNSYVPDVIEAGTGKPVPRFRFGSRHTEPESLQEIAVSPTGGQYALAERPDEVHVFESATRDVRRELRGHRTGVRVLGFTPDGTKLLTAGGDHTVLVWDMRLQSVPLPDTIKKETNAAKLWDTLATGNAKDAYLAMARLAREPDAAIKLAKMKLKPAAKSDRETDATKLTDARAVELLEALDADGHTPLKEIAGGHADAFRTQEAKRALERQEKLENKK